MHEGSQAHKTFKYICVLSWPTPGTCTAPRFLQRRLSAAAERERFFGFRRAEGHGDAEVDGEAGGDGDEGLEDGALGEDAQEAEAGSGHGGGGNEDGEGGAEDGGPAD